jgi:hypothetical protein
MVLARTPKTKEVATRAMKQAQKSFMSEAEAGGDLAGVLMEWWEGRGD